MHLKYSAVNRSILPIFILALRQIDLRSRLLIIEGTTAHRKQTGDETVHSRALLNHLPCDLAQLRWSDP
jgi:hypothetical protein